MVGQVVKVKAKVAQSCPTLCNPMDYTVHGILQARRLEWVALLFSRGSSQPRDQTHVSRIAGGFWIFFFSLTAQYTLKLKPSRLPNETQMLCLTFSAKPCVLKIVTDPFNLMIFARLPVSLSP